MADTLDTLSGLVRAGMIHHLGWSNLTGYQLGTILTTARLVGHVTPTVLQQQYNLLDRTIEQELIPACLDSGTAVVPWSPLGGGWLTGKDRPDQQPTGATRLGEDPTRGVESYEGRNIDRTWPILDVVNELAEGSRPALRTDCHRLAPVPADGGFGSAGGTNPRPVERQSGRV